ncbi:MAG: argininosuccinate lyase, partial [Acidobacteria bacterium]|nr:argininosuccinate lyase [Acidobacteriota bacterium]
RRVSRALGFDNLQSNTLSVQNDRGKTEFLVLGAASSALLDLGRLATDLILFSSDELGFVRLDDSVTTGSSIMPQKRNPDVLELIRATAARVRSRQGEIGAVYSPLGAGYHRDLQLTKEPFLEGMQGVLDALSAVQPVLATLKVDPQRCRAALQRSIGATDAVYLRVAAGEPFRSAYKAVAADPEGAVEGDPAQLWRRRTHEGAPGGFSLEGERQALEASLAWLDVEKQRLDEVWRLLDQH